MSENTLLSERQLRECVIGLVQREKIHLPSSSSDFDIVQSFGLQIVDGDLPLEKDGAYIESESKIVLSCEISSAERRRFTLYHELVHCLVRRDADLYSYLHDAYSETEHFEKTIERICNVGAAEFILPRDTVYQLISTKGFTVELITQLCQTHNISGAVALIQLVQCAPNDCYGVVCEYGIPPTIKKVNQQTYIKPKQSKSLYVLLSIGSPSAKYSISRFTLISGRHLLMQALSEEQLIKGMDKIPFRSGTDWPVPVEIIRFRGNVYGIFNVSPPPNKQQPRLL